MATEDAKGKTFDVEAHHNLTKQPEAILDVIGSTDLDVVAYEQGYIRNRKPNQKLTKAAVELAKKAD